jgi:hypothetical protein
MCEDILNLIKEGWSTAVLSALERFIVMILFCINVRS